LPMCSPRCCCRHVGLPGSSCWPSYHTPERSLSHVTHLNQQLLTALPSRHPSIPPGAPAGARRQDAGQQGDAGPRAVQPQDHGEGCCCCCCCCCCCWGSRVSALLEGCDAAAIESLLFALFALGPSIPWCGWWWLFSSSGPAGTEFVRFHTSAAIREHKRAPLLFVRRCT